MLGPALTLHMSSPLPFEVGAISSPILQMRKLRTREVKQLTEVPAAGEWLSQDLNPGCLASSS